MATAERMLEIGKKSAEVRKVRWGLRRDLKQLPVGEAAAVMADVFEDDRAEFRNMRVDELLAMLGEQRALRILVAAHVAPFRRVCELSDRQRRVIVQRLRGSGA